jgi:hypothetical protein
MTGTVVRRLRQSGTVRWEGQMKLMAPPATPAPHVSTGETTGRAATLATRRGGRPEW